MPDRIANVIVLCEDQEHSTLILRYLLLAGHERRSIRIKPLAVGRGAGSQFVREQFSTEVANCRSILGRKTGCFLIVMTDADNLTVAQKELSLRNTLTMRGDADVTVMEPVVILIPEVAGGNMDQVSGWRANG